MAYRIFAQNIVDVKLWRLIDFWSSFALSFTADDSDGDKSDKKDRADADGGDDSRFVKVDDRALQVHLVVVVNRLKIRFKVQ